MSRLNLRRRCSGRACALAVVIATTAIGCAARSPRSLADRFIKQGEPAVDLGGPPLTATTDEYVAKLRALSAQAQPRTKRVSLEMLEGHDTSLRDALAVVSAGPSPSAHVRVALEYRRLGIADAAFEHASAAVRLDPKNATAYDLRARIWRVWGLAHLGLSDARRAVALAPGSATAWNTLGLILEGAGDTPMALRAYLRSVQIDTQAAYAWNNICRAWTSTGESQAAVQACRRTLALEPSYKEAEVMLYQAGRHLSSPAAERTGSLARAAAQRREAGNRGSVR